MAELPLYTIAIDPARRLMRVSIAGFWTPEVFAAYARDFRTATATLPPGEGGFVTLADVTHAAIQPQELVDAFQAFITRSEGRSRKIALFTPTALPRMQCRRISGGNSFVQVFPTCQEAEAWLFAEEDRAAA